eukprot:scaffold35495_cov50-Prasinocladus_malaysianus.AAC.1
MAHDWRNSQHRWLVTEEQACMATRALEIATSMYPQYFLVLAGSGNLAKSVGKGMGKPAFRVIQQHFSVANNVGDVAAKEEVWEVAGQLSGLAATVGLLKLLESHQSVSTLLGTWVSPAILAAIKASQPELNYTTANMKGNFNVRACMLSVHGCVTS